MKILAVDASMEACSAAVYVNGEIVERLSVAPRKHIELLKPMTEEVIEAAEIELSELHGLAFAVGPGSFAGLRIACGFIQGLGAGLERPIVPISTLAALAYPILEEHPDALVMPMIDAKMNEVYWAIYGLDEEGDLKIIEKDQVNTLAEIYARVEDIRESIEAKTGQYENVTLYGVGDGWLLDEEALTRLAATLVEDRHYPRAGDIALLAKRDLERGLGLYADQVSPVYLRHNIAMTIEEQKAFRAEKAKEKAEG
ncbi:tRNA (adenosine(37)-N6)-threonylcarbamoyltransferase complex dimerization subunit type 1 TsaB [Ignatzschineria cameli]|uniref:tRNA threonylcarbamoyladenosine biosynthesis protein TsaB n=1 Tax=Ignatzschineria cameli TaxID=2182793 RepID=A0A2U2AQY9_9GAMM|nr:tRNA (adenosine(37)-N6)-threonylcarbamoyltransferase complex dimerization subunit type 1 TsaB [Ignatzschineria cameli]PWD86279.1 tRNA (adenosine(37)-N6)-threonylcarbamoyltransferase complex dimerization subunit type 1 TsaB [Ignatzschineria cameli]PWD89883.1 tRNA (adenosine(37)-N6)-threonylcarbamoyltransferase complex dimerization subunit type 1 TsaB [Ignatzschineria cameli]PWD91533.1 tRNA (adenosine(37)-N6)-threonylcarbamoyltransferase complex dimerization subunit type 1 TsaB [Ignatzschineria